MKFDADLNENAIQRAVFQHLRTRGAPGLFAFHPKNGGIHMRGRRSGINVGLGVEPGVHDIIIFRPFKIDQPELKIAFTLVYALELKREGGELSAAQLATAERIKATNAICGVAYGLNDALAWLETHGLLTGRAT